MERHGLFFCSETEMGHGNMIGNLVFKCVTNW